MNTIDMSCIPAFFKTIGINTTEKDKIDLFYCKGLLFAKVKQNNGITAVVRKLVKSDDFSVMENYDARTVDKETLSNMIKELLASNVSQSRIALYLDCSQVTISNFVRKNT